MSSESLNSLTSAPAGLMGRGSARSRVPWVVSGSLSSYINESGAPCLQTLSSGVRVVCDALRASSVRFAYFLVHDHLDIEEALLWAIEEPKFVRGLAVVSPLECSLSAKLRGRLHTARIPVLLVMPASQEIGIWSRIPNHWVLGWPNPSEQSTTIKDAVRLLPEIPQRFPSRRSR